MTLNEKSPRVAIVGPKRSRQGLGEYIAKFLHEEGARVCGVVGSSADSSRRGAEHLRQRYGIETEPYPDLPLLIEKENPDGIVLCSPIRHHKTHLLHAAEGNASVLCEKPLIWNEGEDPVRQTEAVLDRFKQKGIGLFLNAQWPYALEAFERLYPDMSRQNPASFEMELGPVSLGPDMVLDAAPHGISMLLALCGPGEPVSIHAEYAPGLSAARMELRFRWRHANGETDTRFLFRRAPEPPRPAAFAIDGKRVDREIVLPEYRFLWHGGGKSVDIGDPLRKMVRRFLRGLAGEDPGDPREDLLCHARALKTLYKAMIN